MTLKRAPRRLVGRKIVSVDWGAFRDDMEGRRAESPTITLDDGSILTFVVQETGAAYGVEIHRWVREKEEAMGQVTRIRELRAKHDARDLEKMRRKLLSRINFLRADLDIAAPTVETLEKLIEEAETDEERGPLRELLDKIEECDDVDQALRWKEEGP